MATELASDTAPRSVTRVSREFGAGARDTRFEGTLQGRRSAPQERREQGCARLQIPRSSQRSRLTGAKFIYPSPPPAAHRVTREAQARAQALQADPGGVLTIPTLQGPCGGMQVLADQRREFDGEVSGAGARGRHRRLRRRDRRRQGMNQGTDPI